MSESPWGAVFELWERSSANVALASVVLSAGGLAAVLALRRRSAPAAHGAAVVSLVLLLLLPLQVAVLQQVDAGWQLSMWEREQEREREREQAKPTREVVAEWNGAQRPSEEFEGRPSAPVETEASLAMRSQTEFGNDGTAGKPAVAPATHTPATQPRAGDRMTGGHSPPDETPASATQPAVTQPSAGGGAAGGQSPPDESPAVQRVPAYAAVLCVIWVLGICRQLWRASRAARSVRAWRRGCRPVDDAAVLAMVAECARAVGLRRSPRVLQSAACPAPLVCGLWRSTIVLPDSLLPGGDAETLRAVVLHEAAHIRRRDLWVGAAQRLAGILYWWNPGVHRLNIELAELREDLCDNVVLQNGGDRHRYAATLLELAARASASRAAGTRVAASLGLLARSPGRLSGRIHRLVQENRPMAASMTRGSRVMMFGVVFLLGGLTSVCVYRMGWETPRFSPMEDIWLAYYSRKAATEMPVFADVEAVAPVRASDHIVPINDPFTPGDVAAEPAQAPEQDPFSGPSPFAEPDVIEQPDGSPADPFGAPAVAESRPVPDGDFSQWGLDAPRADVAPDDSVPLAALSARFVPKTATPRRASVLVVMEANKDGTLKQVRYLTEKLGNDVKAYEKLSDRIKQWKQRIKSHYPSLETEVQVTAGRELRYEHVADAIAVCSEHVDRMSFWNPAAGGTEVLKVGYVRDRLGQKLLDTPILVWKNEVVPTERLPAALANWMQKSGNVELSKTTLLISFDADVPCEMIEQILFQTQAAGFASFALEELPKPTPHDSSARPL